jgi:hypothetical protein
VWGMGTKLCHQMVGWGFAKVTCDIFRNILNPIFTFCPVFKPFWDIFWGKNENVTSHVGGGEVQLMPCTEKHNSFYTA